MTIRVSGAALAVLVVLVVLLSGCRATGLLFSQPRQIQVLEPAQNAEIGLPVTLRWRVNQAIPRRAEFAVFVDRAPMGPGSTLLDLLSGTCSQGCLSPMNLAEQNIYLTRTNSLVLQGVPVQSLSDLTSGIDEQQVTIVIIGHDGRRIGEQFYSVSFSVRGS